MVFVIDDDPEIRDSMRWLLESVHLQVQCFDNAKAFLEIYNKNMKGCIVTDVRMPGISGVELLEELNKRKSRLPVIIVTGHGDIPMAVRAMKSGAVDFILKPFNDQQLLEQIQNSINLNISQKNNNIVDDFSHRLTLLTTREKEVLQLIVGGKRNKQIAAELNISISTVELHRSNIMRKLAVKTLANLIGLYVRVKENA